MESPSRTNQNRVFLDLQQARFVQRVRGFDGTDPFQTVLIEPFPEVQIDGTGPAWPLTVSWMKVAPKCPCARHPVKERPFPRFLITTRVGEGVPESGRQARRQEVARVTPPGRDQGW